MMIPTVHLNGTSKEGLIEQLCEASQAIELAYSALKRAVPNGRDYHPQGPDAIYKATEEHMDRLHRLDAIKKEIDDLTVAIDQL